MNATKPFIKIDGKEISATEIYCSGADGLEGLKAFAYPYSTNVVLDIGGKRAIISADVFLSVAQLFSATCKKPK